MVCSESWQQEALELEEAFKMDDHAGETDFSGKTSEMLDWKSLLQVLKSWAHTINLALMVKELNKTDLTN